MHILTILDLFARGGGGGSGGGGGGGGGGSGGGGGGGLGVVLILIGGVPPYLVGNKMRYTEKNFFGMLLSFLVSAAYGGFWLWLLIHLTSNYDVDGFWVGCLIIICFAAFVSGPAGFFEVDTKIIRVVRRSKKTELKMKYAARTDSEWNKTELNQYVQKTFLQYQADWSKFDTESMKAYLTPHNWKYNKLMMQALALRKRRNDVIKPIIKMANPVQATDDPGTDHDQVIYSITARARDTLIDTEAPVGSKPLFVDRSSFTEYWIFKRSGNDWLLDEIKQATATPQSTLQPVVDFAAKNDFFYSLDWGWLLLPQRGVLFGKAKFGKSDINNHVIGKSRNLLIELYTYNPSPDRRRKDKYVIAQAALPKRYDSIIVQAKSRFSWLKRTPKGYNKISMEWPDFNKRYTVYATNVEQVTAFELLHPVYMEKLFALPFKVSIEVVDNVVYLYTPDKNADYALMYDILQRAFDEMKL